MNLDERIKMYEKAEQPKSYNKNDFIIVRLDGRGFSKFTSNMTKPFDDNFTEAMHEATKAVFKESNAVLAYQQSDEITLVLKNFNDKSDFIFGGKIQKIISVLSGLCSVKFYQSISKKYGEICEKKIPHFDARIFRVPNEYEAVNAVLWRVQDAVRNSTSMLGRSYLTHSEMTGMSTESVRERLLKDFNVDFVALPEKFKCGSFFRKELYFKEDSNAFRTRISIEHPDFLNMTTQERLNVVFGDKLNDTEVPEGT